MTEAHHIAKLEAENATLRKKLKASVDILASDTVAHLATIHGVKRDAIVDLIADFNPVEKTQ